MESYTTKNSFYTNIFSLVVLKTTTVRELQQRF